MQGKCSVRYIQQYLYECFLADLHTSQNSLECCISHSHGDNQICVLRSACEREQSTIVLVVSFRGIDKRHPYMLASPKLKSVRFLKNESHRAFCYLLFTPESDLKFRLLH